MSTASFSYSSTSFPFPVFEGIRRGATTHDLRELTEKLLAADVNGASVDLRLDLQGKGMSDDLAARPYVVCGVSLHHSLGLMCIEYECTQSHTHTHRLTYVYIHSLFIIPSFQHQQFVQDRARVGAGVPDHQTLGRTAGQLLAQRDDV